MERSISASSFIRWPDCRRRNSHNYDSCTSILPSPIWLTIYGSSPLSIPTSPITV